jgi:spermidine synthase
MIPWKLLSTAQSPGASGELRLYQRGTEFSIRVGASELMNSSVHGSEERLAELACSRIANRPHPHVLIGGLGMGYTLAAALRRLPSGGKAVVTELMPAVVAWNRGPLAHLAGAPLDDKRVRVRELDVGEAIRAEPGAFDAILLDVDNGPHGLTRKGNDWLYSAAGLQAAWAALRPRGVLAVWSAGPDDAFARRMRAVGFKVVESLVRAREERGRAKHTIWSAMRGA